MRILLTNDDGILSPGLLALKSELAELGEVTVVAPLEEQSAVSHAISLHVPARMGLVPLPDGASGFAVEGTPVDAVNLGLLEVFDSRPDLVASGINLGLNTGTNIFYSGTVAAALEGALNGILSVAVSAPRAESQDFDRLAEWALRTIRTVIAKAGRGPAAYNINLPEPRAKEPEVVFTAQGFEPTSVQYGRISSRPEWPSHGPKVDEAESNCLPRLSDVEAVNQGKVSVTPLVTNLTDTNCLRMLNASESGAR